MECFDERGLMGSVGWWALEGLESVLGALERNLARPMLVQVRVKVHSPFYFQICLKW